MKQNRVRFVVITITLAMLFMLGGTAAFAQEPNAELQTETVFITSPADGETVLGIIEIIGAVDFPDFMKYEVFLKSGKNLIWVATVYAPVVNGLLARLDTKIIADGTYQLITRQVRSDSNYTEAVGPTITIKNDVGAPKPHPEVHSSPLYPPVAGALLRVHSCGGFNTEFDYASPQGFCSFGNLWLMPKLQDQPLCTTVDILLIPNCEYRGTLFADDNKGNAARYEFLAEPGKIYELHYPGTKQLFLGEVKGDARLPTDTGGNASQTGVDFDPPAPAVAAPTAGAPAQEQPLLPVSGQAAVSNMPFAIVAAGLILFMVIGGVAAIYRGRQNSR
jgi:hypothetical protein